MIKIKVFIPHRWETGCIDDYKIISGLLDRSNSSLQLLRHNKIT